MPNPSRRPALLIAGAAVLVVALIAVISTAAGGESGPTPGPTAALEPQGAVLLVPGYGGGTAVLTPAANALAANGITTSIVAIDDGTGDLASYADRVVEQAQALIAQGAPSVDVVGFSAGGLIARSAATREPGSSLIRRVVMVGTPNQGTELASLGALLNQCPTACQQIEPDSDFLAGLPLASATERYLTIWSSSDEVVRPTDSSRLNGATEFLVQDVCARDVAHNALMNEPVTLAAIQAFLANQALPTTC